MNKTISFMFLLSASALFGATADCIKDLSNSDIHIADAARMSLQNDCDKTSESALIKDFETQKNPILKSGLAYSLGKIQSKKAFNLIAKEAERNDIVGLSSILALGYYKNAEALKVLKALESKCGKDKRRITAISMATSIAEGRIPDSKYLLSSVPSDFNTLDDNQKADVIRRLGKSPAVKKSLIEAAKETQSERIYVALVPALLNQGGADSLQTIFDLKTKVHTYKDPIFIEAMTLIQGDGVEEILLKGVEDKNITAINSVGRRGVTKAEDLLIKLTEDNNKYVAAAAFNALGEIGTTKSLNIIISKIEDSNDVYYKNAVKSLSQSLPRFDDKTLAETKSKVEYLSKNAKNNQKVYAKVLTLFNK